MGQSRSQTRDAHSHLDLHPTDEHHCVLPQGGAERQEALQLKLLGQGHHCREKHTALRTDDATVPTLNRLLSIIDGLFPVFS